MQQRSKKIIYYIVLVSSVLSIMGCILAAASVRLNVKDGITAATANDLHQQLTVIEVIGTLSVIIFVGLLLFQNKLLAPSVKAKQP